MDNLIKYASLVLKDAKVLSYLKEVFQVENLETDEPITPQILLNLLGKASPEVLKMLLQYAEEVGWGYDENGNQKPIVYLLTCFLADNYVI